MPDELEWVAAREAEETNNWGSHGQEPEAERDAFLQAIDDTVAALDDTGVDHLFIGGIASTVLGRPRVGVRYRRARPGAGWFRRMLTTLADVQYWLDILHGLIRFPIGVATFAVVVTWWAVTLAGLTYGLWGWSVPAEVGPVMVNDRPLPDVLGVENTLGNRILVNGTVLTMDAADGIAQAIALRGDRIAAVGTDREIRRLAGPHAEVIDLGGRTVIPGLIDTHIHAIRGGQSYAFETYWHEGETTSLAAGLEQLRQTALARGPGKWVAVTGSWHPDQFVEKRAIERDFLTLLAQSPFVLLQGGHIGS